MLQVSGAATVYLVLVHARLAFAIQPEGVTAPWAPTGVALAALTLRGRAWPSMLGSISPWRRRWPFRRPASLPCDHTGILGERSLAHADITPLARAGVVSLA